MTAAVRTAGILALFVAAALGPQPARGNGGTCTRVFLTVSGCSIEVVALDYSIIGTGVGVLALSLGAVVDIVEPWQSTGYTIVQTVVVGVNMVLMGVLSAIASPRLAAIIPLVFFDLALVAHSIFRFSHPPPPEPPVARDAFYRPIAYAR